MSPQIKHTVHKWTLAATFSANALTTAVLAAFVAGYGQTELAVIAAIPAILTLIYGVPALEPLFCRVVAAPHGDRQ
jgi:hypothetical protein